MEEAWKYATLKPSEAEALSKEALHEAEAIMAKVNVQHKSTLQILANAQRASVRDFVKWVLSCRGAFYLSLFHWRSSEKRAAGK